MQEKHLQYLCLILFAISTAMLTIILVFAKVPVIQPKSTQDSPFTTFAMKGNIQQTAQTNTTAYYQITYQCTKNLLFFKNGKSTPPIHHDGTIIVNKQSYNGQEQLILQKFKE